MSEGFSEEKIEVALTPTGANWSSAIGMDIEYSEQGTR